MTGTCAVEAKPWSGGWELHIAGEGVTQVRTLDKAVARVRDYLATLHNRDFSGAEIAITYQLDGLEEEIESARAKTAAAAEAQREAAVSVRKVVADLRAKGLSVSDTATALGVSRGRISQLTKS